MAAGTGLSGRLPESGPERGALACAWARMPCMLFGAAQVTFACIRCRFPVSCRSPVETGREFGASPQFALPSSHFRIAPNPFSGVTRVSYNLPVAGNVSSGCMTS